VPAIVIAELSAMALLTFCAARLVFLRDEVARRWAAAK
jgi:hypothetical protein